MCVWIDGVFQAAMVVFSHQPELLALGLIGVLQSSFWGLGERVWPGIAGRRNGRGAFVLVHICSQNQKTPGLRSYQTPCFPPNHHTSPTPSVVCSRLKRFRLSVRKKG